MRSIRFKPLNFRCRCVCEIGENHDKNRVNKYDYNHVKKLFCNKKRCFFLKISDPAKRDAIVKEYLDLKKNIQDNLLSERTGKSELQSELTKFYRPITETQKATAREITEGLKPIREITEGLKPIREGIDKLPQAIGEEASKKFGEEASKKFEEEEDKSVGDRVFRVR